MARGSKNKAMHLGGGRSPKAKGSPKAAVNPKTEKMHVAKKVGKKIAGMKFGGAE